jgi:hypothetical protein
VRRIFLEYYDIYVCTPLTRQYVLAQLATNAIDQRDARRHVASSMSNSLRARGSIWSPSLLVFYSTYCIIFVHEEQVIVYMYNKMTTTHARTIDLYILHLHTLYTHAAFVRISHHFQL